MKSERGLILILSALASVLLVGLCALVVGLGLHLSNTTRIRNITNAASLAAIEEWVKLGNSNLSNSQKITEIKNRVNLIFEKNKIPGFQSSALHIGKIYLEGQEQADSAGVLRPGRMYPRDPEDGTNPCTDYPCMKYYNVGHPGLDTATVNAFQLLVKTRVDNPLILPFAQIFGQNKVQLTASATATFVERCTAFLMDVSLSVYSESHPSKPRFFRENFPNVVIQPSPPVNRPYDFVTDPLEFSVPFIRIDPQGSMPDCRRESFFEPDGIYYFDTLAYCQRPPMRTFGGTGSSGSMAIRDRQQLAPPDWNPFPHNGEKIQFLNDPTGTQYRWPIDLESLSDKDYIQHHFQNDYERYEYGPTNILYDGYIDRVYQGPEPFTSYMKAMNVALQTLESQRTAFDLATMKVFTGFRASEIPPFYDGSFPSTSTPGFTSNLNYLMQISDPRNRGTYTRGADSSRVNINPQVHPNFIDHGWYSYITNPLSEPPSPLAASSTNLVEILDETIEELKQCPKNSKKQIVLLTDGIMNCSYLTHSSSTELNPNGELEPLERIENVNRTCSNYQYDNYLLAEEQLIGESGGQPYGSPRAGGYTYPSILERLLENEIAVSVLLSGSYVEPNFMNVADPTPGCSDPNRCTYLEYLEALGLGLGSLGYPGPGECGLGPSGECDFFDFASTCPGYDEEKPECNLQAWKKAGRAGFIFRRPNAVLGRLAMRTGGLWCPLMPQGTPDMYDSNGNLKAQFRTNGAPQTVSVFNISKAEYAARCASSAVGHNPYMLNEPLSIDLAP